MGDDHQRQTGRADRRPDDLAPGRGLLDHRRGDDDREDDLGLQHQRGQASRHPEVERDVQQAELAQAHERADSDDGLPGRLRPRDEPHREEQQGRHPVETLVDDHEVGSPQHRDEQGERAVAQSHGVSLSRIMMKHQQRFVRLKQYDCFMDMRAGAHAA